MTAYEEQYYRPSRQRPLAIANYRVLHKRHTPLPGHGQQSLRTQDREALLIKASTGGEVVGYGTHLIRHTTDDLAAVARDVNEIRLIQGAPIDPTAQVSIHDEREPGTDVDQQQPDSPVGRAAAAKASVMDSSMGSSIPNHTNKGWIAGERKLYPADSECPETAVRPLNSVPSQKAPALSEQARWSITVSDETLDAPRSLGRVAE